MVNCSIANCKNTSAKISKNKDGITFHRFPRDKERRRQWEIAVNREEAWSSTTSSAVCSEHFDTKDFYITESGLRRLSAVAVPAINISPCQEPAPTISNCQPVDIKSTDTDEVIKLKHKVRRLEIIANNRKRKINLMWQNKRRLKKKLQLTKCLIGHLIENKKEEGNKSCEQNNCVFRALNIVSESGFVDIDAYSRLLNNFTDLHPAWLKAKGRVVTKCLSKPISNYEYDCQINKILACTFDVLSENCPNSKSPDVCRHSGTTLNEVICQISSSRYRPKNRRLFCGLPNLVNYQVLSQCNLNSLINLEYVPETVFKPKSFLSTVSSVCKDSTPSTTCVMDSMGVLNKYNFMDYFKMKDRIRTFSYGEWYPYKNAYTAVFQSVPLYKDYCSSPKKLLNVIDTMLLTCPYSERRNTPQCNKMFSDLTKDIPKNGTQNEELMKIFGHVLLTNQHLDIGLVPKNRRIITNPMFDFGMFNSENAPPVRTIDLRKETDKPIVLLPVYQRKPYKDNILRGGRFTSSMI